uniref:Ribosomal protein S2 n=1 Tax=Chaetosphaeridium globosum TaxID=96477 RepID=Q8M1D9_CHAGL|nr:ribosomal protein S2 [Chaetosphaeridium globosum]AAM96624.1 ribosomal protein S2 [Chaetosphaeridium globosum]
MIQSNSLVISKLLKINAHLGRPKLRTSHVSRYFLYGLRSNTRAIFDLEKTLTCIRRACHFLESILDKQGCILFVSEGPNSPYNAIIKETALKTNQSFITTKWIGGLLTNWKHISYYNHLSYDRPSCLIVFNPCLNFTAIQEANTLGIPVVSLMNSNVPNHLKIDYPIPVNHNSISFIYLFCNLIVKLTKLE